MELPQDLLPLIKEFSMPITRPDWRSIHIMTLDVYRNSYRSEVRKRYIKITNGKSIEYKRMFQLYHYSHFFGHCCQYGGVCPHDSKWI